MRQRALWATVGVLVIMFLLAAEVSAQSTTYKVYGYVRVDGNLTNGVTVQLSGEGILARTDTRNSGGSDGYYEFIVNGSDAGKALIVSASHNSRSGSYSFIMPDRDKSANLNLVVPVTPTPSPTPTPTPTPRPPGSLGGDVKRNNSYFVAAPVHNPSIGPTLKPSHAGPASPTAEPTPTPVPSTGLFSNAYLWLAIALIAILAIAAAIMLYLRK